MMNLPLTQSLLLTLLTLLTTIYTTAAEPAEYTDRTRADALLRELESLRLHTPATPSGSAGGGYWERL